MTPRPEDIILAVEELTIMAAANEACATAALDHSGVYAGDDGQALWHPDAARNHADRAHSLRSVIAWLSRAAQQQREAA